MSLGILRALAKDSLDNRLQFCSLSEYSIHNISQRIQAIFSTLFKHAVECICPLPKFALQRKPTNRSGGPINFVKMI
jgi:hypothetical protein